MKSRSIQNVSVWLDDSLGQETAFRQGLHWARWLGVPLRVVADSSYGRATPAAIGGSRPAGRAERRSDPMRDTLASWSTACNQRDVALQTLFWQGTLDSGIDYFVHPTSLCVIEETRKTRLGQALFQRSQEDKELALLVCRADASLLTRILVLYEYMDPGNAFLQSVVALSKAFQVNPIVLVVSHKEREGQLRLAYAEGFFTSHQVLADFDLMIGCDIPTAVSRVSSWRQCSHVVIERERPSSSWFRWRGDLLNEQGAFAKMSILALPEATSLGFPEVPGRVGFPPLKQAPPPPLRSAAILANQASE